MTCRLASVLLVLVAALADAMGSHTLAYYALVAAVPVAVVAAVLAFGDVVDGSAADPLDRRLALLSALAAPLVLLGAASRAPLVEDAPPPTFGVAAVVTCLGIFALQAFLTAAAVHVRPLRAKRSA